MAEIWKTIEKFPNYKVSNTGRVINTKTNKEVKASINKYGYQLMPFSVDGKRTSSLVHTLVAAAFVENDCPEIKREVHHIDGNKINNNADNLMWVTREENLQYGSPGNAPYIKYILNRTRDLLNNYYEYIDDKAAKEIMVFVTDAIITSVYTKQNNIEYR